MFSSEGKNRLRFDAVPTIFDAPYNTSQLKGVSKVKLRSKLPAVKSVTANAETDFRVVDENVCEKPEKDGIIDGLNSELSNTPKSTSDSIKRTISPTSRNLRSGHRVLRSRSTSQPVNKAAKRMIQILPNLTPAQIQQQHVDRVQYLEAQVELLQQQLQRAKDVDNDRAITKEEALDILKSEFTNGEYFFLQSMLKRDEHEYSEQEKCFFILMYMHGAKGYEYLRQRQINIPKRTFLYKWMEEFGCGPVNELAE